jgi:hypothetical protein
MRMRMSSEEESDDKDSMVTIRANNTDENLILHPTDPDDFINANTVSTDYEENSQTSTIQTIVEVVNPMLVGDGTATEIAIGKSMEIDESNLPYDEDDIDIVYRREMSLNDKMKNVLKELRENEKVRLSLSRSMEEKEEDVEDEDQQEHQVNEHEEILEKQGANGTVFMVRERLINDFYEHKEEIVDENEEVEKVENIITKSETNKSFNESSQATIFVNPSAVDEFLANEIRHAQETSNEVVENNSLRARKEALTLDLNQTSTINDENDDDEGEDEGATPTTPTKGAAGKRKRRKNKNKKK